LAYIDVASNAFISSITKEIASQPLITHQGQASIELGYAAAKMSAVVLFLLFASLVSSISPALIRAGAGMLCWQSDHRYKQIKQHLSSLLRHGNGSRPVDRKGS